MSDYSFIKEIVKKKPFDKREFFIKIGYLIGAGVIFGSVAAIAFAGVLPMVETGTEKSRQGSQISIEETNLGADQAVEEEEAVNREKEDTKVVEVPAQLGLAEYKHLYQEMMQTSKEAARSMVTVIGITDNMDWFRNMYENQKQLSGLLIADSGQELFVLTEYRAVKEVDRIQVIFWDGMTVDAHFLKQDPSTGLCVIKIGRAEVRSETLNSLSMAPLDSSYEVQQGEPIVVMGSPMGYSDSMAFGMVTSVSNKVSGMDTEYTLLTTDIQGVKEGSGFLLNLDGQIIGVILQQYSTTGNMVTCLASSEITGLLEDLSNNRKIPYVGVKGQEVTADVSEKTGLPKGIYVNEVKVDSPIMLAGLKNGDVIQKVNGKSITTLEEYSKEIKECSIGEVIQITAMRKGAEGYSEIVFDVTVAAL